MGFEIDYLAIAPELILVATIVMVLVLDFVLPGERCCCGARLYPQTRCSPHACEDTVVGRVPCTCYPEP